MSKYQYKYKLMSRSEFSPKWSEYTQFTFSPEKVKEEFQKMWPTWEFKVILNPKRNI